MGMEAVMAGAQALDNLLTHRLVILQWLAVGEKLPMGDRLRERLLAAGIREDRIELIDCQSRAEVISSIEKVIDRTTVTNVPVLHIECHGAIDEQSIAVGLGGGEPNSPPRNASELLWVDLDPLPENHARKAQFRNVVVLSGCQTDDLMKYWKTRALSGTGHTLSGTYDLTYDLKIMDIFLLQSGAAFYSALFVGERPIDVCVGVANQYNQHIDVVERPFKLKVELLRIANQLTTHCHHN